MKPEAVVIEVLGKHRIYVEHYKQVHREKTLILVNGAFATTSSFNQTVRYLKEHVNLVLFDLPYAGQSKEHNPDSTVLSKDDEVEILLELLERYQVNYLMSVSWGGVSSLLSLARRPASMERAIIASFSPVINPAMHDYMTGARNFLQCGDLSSAAHLLNNTVGRYLSSLVKTHNFRYLIESLGGNEEQLIFHINQIFDLDREQYMQRFSSIGIPVLFMNGELDEYTTPQEARSLASHIARSEFAVVEGAGHFLDLESRQLWKKVSHIVRGWMFGEATDTVEPMSFAAAFHTNLAVAEAVE
ncbi:alpha/beta fold hydrolase [Granulicella paludicola]|uniref:alpha/beta fold hydrolase n=1 Tax=Granulicella paludicola TaxID=474951 RepID=UPI0021DFB819|nr:alpha/beta hydrolase [Granulicella paludicola]